MAFALVIAVIQALVPRHAQGQHLPARMQSVPAEIALPEIAGATGDLPLLSVLVVTAPVRSRYTLPADTAAGGLKRRIMPYAIGGALIGGVIGYAAMPKSCDVGENMFCGYTRVGIPFVGVGVGAWAGILVGYIRERE